MKLFFCSFVVLSLSACVFSAANSSVSVIYYLPNRLVACRALLLGKYVLFSKFAVRFVHRCFVSCWIMLYFAVGCMCACCQLAKLVVSVALSSISLMARIDCSNDDKLVCCLLALGATLTHSLRTAVFFDSLECTNISVYTFHLFTRLSLSQSCTALYLYQSFLSTIDGVDDLVCSKARTLTWSHFSLFFFNPSFHVFVS